MTKRSLSRNENRLRLHRLYNAFCKYSLPSRNQFAFVGYYIVFLGLLYIFVVVYLIFILFYMWLCVVISWKVVIYSDGDNIIIIIIIVFFGLRFKLVLLVLLWLSWYFVTSYPLPKC